MKSSNDFPEEVRRTFARRLLAWALASSPGWPPRAASSLDLIGEKLSPDGLLDAEARRSIRESAKPEEFGSTFLVTREGESLQIHRLADLLFEPDVGVREVVKAALMNCIARVSRDEKELHEVAAVCQGLISKDQKTWMRSADALYRFDRDDFRVGLLRLVEKARLGAQAVQRDDVWSVFGMSDQVKAALRAVWESSGTEEADVLLRASQTISSLHWQWHGGGEGAAANAYGLPGAFDELFAGARTDEMWRRIGEAASFQSKMKRGIGRRIAMLDRFAQHFFKVAECMYPGMNASRMEECAVGMALYVENALHSIPVSALKAIVEHVREVWGIVDLYWRYSRAPLYPSDCYRSVISGESLFASRLRKKILQHLSGTASVPAAEDEVSVSAFIASSMVRRSMWLEFPGDAEIATLAELWIGRTNDESVRRLRDESHELGAALRDLESLPSALSHVGKGGSLDVGVLVSCIDDAVRTGSIPVNKLSEVWRMEGWFVELAALEGDELDLVFTSLLSCFDFGPSEESLDLTHRIVDALLSRKLSKTGSAKLVSYLAALAVRTNGPSAIERLLSQTEGDLLHEDVRKEMLFLREQVASAPDWLTGRMRDLCVIAAI